MQNSLFTNLLVNTINGKYFNQRSHVNHFSFLVHLSCSCILGNYISQNCTTRPSESIRNISFDTLTSCTCSQSHGLLRFVCCFWDRFFSVLIFVFQVLAWRLVDFYFLLNFLLILFNRYLYDYSCILCNCNFYRKICHWWSIHNTFWDIYYFYSCISYSSHFSL